MSSPGPLDPRAIKTDLVKIYPKKLGKKRAEQIVVNEHREDGSVPEVKANAAHGARNHYPARLHLRRLQRRGDRPHA